MKKACAHGASCDGLKWQLPSPSDYNTHKVAGQCVNGALREMRNVLILLGQHKQVNKRRLSRAKPRVDRATDGWHPSASPFASPTAPQPTHPRRFMTRRHRRILDKKSPPWCKVVPRQGTAELHDSSTLLQQCCAPTNAIS